MSRLRLGLPILMLAALASGCTRDPDQAEPASTRGGQAALPFIAETRTAAPAIDLLSPGRLEVRDGCLTVAFEGGQPGVAVFPPGVKPELKDGRLAAVTFEGRRIPVGEETVIPGGGLSVGPDQLARPLPENCPAVLFGVGG